MVEKDLKGGAGPDARTKNERWWNKDVDDDRGQEEEESEGDGRERWKGEVPYSHERVRLDPVEYCSRATARRYSTYS